MKRKRIKKYSKLDRLLEIPREVVSSDIKVTLNGFDEILIENYKNILEYQEFYIRINTYTGIININGFNLKLEEMTSDDLKIEGKIEGIDFENTIDEEE